MGRKKIYNSKKEKHEAELRWKREYYYRNKKRLNEKSMQNYKKSKSV